MILDLVDRLDAIFRVRACWVCGQRVWCGHRELAFELAELNAGEEQQGYEVSDGVR